MTSNVKKADFVHLHVHSEFSLLDGMGKIHQLVDRAASLGMEALALTDHGVMFGAVDFYLEAVGKGIKPIVGCEYYLAPRKLSDKEPKLDSSSFHLTTLVTDGQGYRNAIHMASVAQLEGFYYRPRIDMDLLESHSNGLLCLSGCPSSQISRLILDGNVDAAIQAAGRYKEIFGKDDFFLEVQNHDLDIEHRINKGILQVAKATGIPFVGTNDVHYVNAEDSYAHDVLLCIGTNSSVSDEKRMRMEGQYHMRSPDEMRSVLSEFPGAYENTLEIARRCSLELDFGRISLPEIDIPADSDADQHLRHLVLQGLDRRLGRPGETYLKRADHELKTITDLGFAVYFLIHADIFRFARSKGMLAGPRGSVGGSLVAFALEISDIDPVVRRIPFERFLNEGRKGQPPDIDMDFPDEGREEVIQYVVQKYGRDRVAQIATFGTMAARAAIRDVGRALGLPYGKVDQIARAVPYSAVDPWDLPRALDRVPEIRDQYDQDAEIKQLIDTAIQLEGVARNASVHAAGVVVSNVPLTEHVPLMRGTSTGDPVAQFTFGTLERLGFLKMDFLGLATFRTISTAIDLIEQNYGTKLIVQELPFDDKKTFELLAKGRTVGVFQLEGAAMTRHLVQLRPSRIEDIAVMVALYRPGPMSNIETYIEAKRNPVNISYLHDQLRPILEETYGVMVYQDQVLLAAREIAGFSWPEIDVMRKAMGKKIAAELDIQRGKFIEGAVNSGLSINVAETIYSQIEPFGGYGFNKAHAFFYGTVAYWTAYLKANYPVEFMTSLLITHSGDTAKTAAAVAECRTLGIDVEPPSILESGVDFTPQEGQIRFGLCAVKNVGRAAVESIVRVREAGPFKSLYEFCERIDEKVLNRRVIESLVKAGAFDGFGERPALLQALDGAMTRAQKLRKTGLVGQETLFDGLGIDDEASVLPVLPEVTALTDAEKATMEFELLGMSFSPDNIDLAWPELRQQVDVLPSELTEMDNGRNAIVGGRIDDMRLFRTRTGKQMGAFRLNASYDGFFDVTVPPRSFDQLNDWVKDGVVARMRVRLEIDDRGSRAILHEPQSIREFVPISEDLVDPSSVSGGVLSSMLREKTDKSAAFVSSDTKNANEKFRLVQGSNFHMKEEGQLSSKDGGDGMNGNLDIDDVLDRKTANNNAYVFEQSHDDNEGAVSKTGRDKMDEAMGEAALVRITLNCSGAFENDQILLGKVDNLARNHTGETELRVLLAGIGDGTELRWASKVSVDQKFVDEAGKLFGKDSVMVQTSLFG
tara:strand:- start:411 stop:4202 length:3792 start_codon:yes stop_codon:yes gene_type:complete